MAAAESPPSHVGSEQRAPQKDAIEIAITISTHPIFVAISQDRVEDEESSPVSGIEANERKDTCVTAATNFPPFLSVLQYSPDDKMGREKRRPISPGKVISAETPW